MMLLLLAQGDPSVLNGLTQYGALGFLALASILANRILWNALLAKEEQCKAERAEYKAEREKDREAYLVVLNELRDTLRDISKKVGA